MDRRTRAMLILITSCYTLVITVQCNGTNGRRHHRHSRHENAAMAAEFNQRLVELKDWTCAVPRPRLVYEENERMSEPNAQWIPPVAILHRCEQATGCCSNPRFSCKPIATESVSLVFHRLDMIRNVATYERLSFINHTACACLSNDEEDSGLS